MPGTPTRLFPPDELPSLRARICTVPEGLKGPRDLAGAWIFGAGSMGQFLADYLRRNGVEPGGFLDNARRGGWVEGLPVLAPDSPEAKRGHWVLIGVKDAAAQVEAQCRELGYTRLVRGWHALHAWAERSQVPGYVSPSRAFLDRWESYEEAAGLFADKTSRQVLKRAIQYQITCQDEDLPPFDPDEYFRPGLNEEAYAEVVDCGAFDGDTLKAFLARHPRALRAYHAFEPDPANFGRLSDFVRGLPAEMATRVRIYPMATGARSGQLRFKTGEGLSSGLRSDGDGIVEVVPLDAALKDAAPSFLKLDIEGAEPEALAGAEGLIRRYCPLLAVCVYHRPEHYLSIPRWIHGLGLGYRLELRHHTRYFTSTVCYAVPPALQGPVRG